MNIEQTPEQLQRVREQADKIIRDTFAPYAGSPTADLIGTALSSVVASRRPDLVSADELDAYHGFPSLRPITIRNAGLVLREATKRLKAAELVKFNADAAAEEADRALREAQAAVKEAKHLLEVSALQPNGGEE